MTMIRNLAVAVAISFAVVAPAQAAEERKFDAAAFAAAQAQGRPILVHVKAWWCAVCASQGRSVKAAITSAAYNNLVIFTVNYDKEKAVMRRFAATKQATMIAFRGTNQTGRLDGVTDRAQIGTLLAASVR